MKVILQQDVKGHGKKGQLVEASDGYARNFLLPRKLAVEATAANLNTMKIQDEAKKHKAEMEKAAAVEDATRLNGKTVRVEVKSGTGGRLFGAVTSKEIAEIIKAQCGVEVPKNKVVMNDTIKTLGTFGVKIKLHPDVTAEMTVFVTDPSIAE